MPDTLQNDLGEYEIGSDIVAISRDLWTIAAMFACAFSRKTGGKIGGVFVNRGRLLVTRANVRASTLKGKSDMNIHEVCESPTYRTLCRTIEDMWCRYPLQRIAEQIVCSDAPPETRGLAFDVLEYAKGEAGEELDHHRKSENDIKNILIELTGIKFPPGDAGES